MESYRIKRTTIALVQENQRHVAYTVPINSVVSLAEGKSLNGSKLVEVIWNGQQVLMFAQDLRTHTSRLDDIE
jgi:hypothetical protein